MRSGRNRLAIRRTAVPLIAFLLSTVPSFLSAQVRPHFPDRSYSTLQFRDAFWLATPRGLYRYRNQENIWSVLGQQNGLLSNRITQLAEDQDILWIGQDRGVTSFDLRNNTMLHFDSSNGLPAGEVRSIAFEPDFVWVGTEHGAGRYDKLIEQWQRIDRENGLEGEHVHLITRQLDVMFLCTEAGISEYDPRYERWRHYRPEGGEIRDAFLAGSTAWLLRETDVLRFDFQSKVFHRYDLEGIGSFDDIQSINIDGSGFWIVTLDDLWQYDAASDNFRPFRDRTGLPDPEIRGASLSGDASSIWFSTRTALSRFNRQDRSWNYFNTAAGLPALNFEVLLTTGNEFVGVANEQIVYYRGAENRWFTYDLLREGSGPGTRVSLDPAEGSYVDFGSGYRLDLSGTRSSWLFRSPFALTGAASRNDLKARLELGGDRTLNASYNDSDYEDVVYGATYRGSRSDVLNTLQAGDLRTEQGSRSLLQSLGLFGGGGRLVFGDRTPRYGRSFVDISGSTGHKTTSIVTEIYYGRKKEHSAVIADTEYSGGQYYSLRAGGLEQPVEAGPVRVYAALAPDAAPTNNILPEREIAGYSGDWVELDGSRDYVLEASRGIVDVSGNRYRTEALAATFVSAGVQQTVLLASPDSSTHQVVNRYFLRGRDIIPATLALKIVDHAGAEQPLRDYGVDGNGDGRVDPEFIMHDAGVLRFPQSHPFPDWVYDDSARSEYRIVANFQTFSTGYILGHDHVRRGSEQITVDGLTVKAGEDYILDYTSGYLLFTRDGVINDDSRVEITYEYIRNAVDERHSQVTATLSPSDYSQAALTAGRFNPQGSTLDVNFGHGLVEARWVTDAFDLRIVPEYASSFSDSGSGSAYGLMAAFSSGPARLTVQTRKNGSGYVEPFERRFAKGLLNSENTISAEYDVIPEVRLFGSWKKRGGTDESDGSPTGDEFLYAGTQLTPPELPSLTVRGERITEHGGGGRVSRRGGRGDLTWALPAGALQALGISSALLTSYARYSEEEHSEEAYGVRQFQNYFFRTVVSPRQLFSINAYYRGDLEKQRSPGGVLPSVSREKLFADVVMEHLRGLSFGLRYDRDLQLLYHLLEGNTWDANDRSSLQLSARFSPGAFVGALSSLTLHFNYSNGTASYVTEGMDRQDLFLSLLSPLGGLRSWANRTDVIETRLEWLPASEFLYTVTGRYQESDAARLSSAYLELRRELVQRADYRPGSRALYSVQLSLSNGGNPWSSFVRYAPLAWMEHRLSSVVLTRVIVNSYHERRYYGLDEVETSDLAPALNLTLSIPKLFFPGRVELRDDFSYHYTEKRSNPPSQASGVATSESVLTNTVYADIYPHPVSYFRLRYSRIWPLTSGLPVTDDLSLQVVLQL